MQSTTKTRTYSNRRIVTVLATLLLATTCGASSITYTVNRSVGLATVTGFVETDGTLGVLGAANFIDWNLFLQDGSSTYDLLGPLSGNNSSAYVQGSDLSATATQLLFNFSGNDDGYFLIQYGFGVHDGFHYYCDSTFSGTCLTGETVAPDDFTQGQTVSRSGEIVIGSTVPEPSSLLLFGSSILGLLGVIRRTGSA